MRRYFFGLFVLLAGGLSLIILSPANVQASGCYSGYNSYGYGYNTTYTPTYAAPTYEKSYYDVSPVVVIGVPVTGLGLDYYYTVGDELREERLANAVAARLQQSSSPQVLSRNVQSTYGYGYNNTQIQTQTQQQYAAPAQVQQQQSMRTDESLTDSDFSVVTSNTYGNSYAQQTPKVNFDSLAHNIFTSDCRKCHGPGVSKSGIVLLAGDGSLYKDPDPMREQQRRQAIYASILPDAQGKVAMPKNGVSLSADKISIINEWKNGG